MIAVRTKSIHTAKEERRKSEGSPEQKQSEKTGFVIIY